MCSIHTPQITVRCNALDHDPNRALGASQLFLGLPAPLFTFDLQGLPPAIFKRFFDALSPTFSHMISLGQSNTIISCPALTTHSELNRQQLNEAGLQPTTIRVAVGDEDPGDLVRHIVEATRLTIDPHMPGYSTKFLSTLPRSTR